MGKAEAICYQLLNGSNIYQRPWGIDKMDTLQTRQCMVENVQCNRENLYGIPVSGQREPLSTPRQQTVSDKFLKSKTK